MLASSEPAMSILPESFFVTLIFILRSALVNADIGIKICLRHTLGLRRSDAGLPGPIKDPADAKAEKRMGGLFINAATGTDNNDVVNPKLTKKMLNNQMNFKKIICLGWMRLAQ